MCFLMADVTALLMVDVMSFYRNGHYLTIIYGDREREGDAFTFYTKGE